MLRVRKNGYHGTELVGPCVVYAHCRSTHRDKDWTYVLRGLTAWCVALLGGMGSAVAADALPAHAPLDSPVLQIISGRQLPTLGSEALGLPQAAAGLGLRLDLRRDSQLLLRLDSDNSSLLCADGYGLATAVGGLAERCLLDQLDRSLKSQLPAQARLGVQLFWPATSAVDLSFGLSWLRPVTANAQAEQIHGIHLFGEQFQPGLYGEVSGLRLDLQGLMQSDQGAWLRISGGQGRYNLLMPELGAPHRWSSSTLGMDAGYGTFSGGVLGRRVDSPLLRRPYVDFDVGLSWRTPWSGRVTVGARNLLGNAEAAVGVPAPLSREDDSEARMPYVRYHQDL